MEEVKEVAMVVAAAMAEAAMMQAAMMQAAMMQAAMVEAAMVEAETMAAARAAARAAAGPRGHQRWAARACGGRRQGGACGAGQACLKQRLRRAVSGGSSCGERASVCTVRRRAAPSAG